MSEDVRINACDGYRILEHDAALQPHRQLLVQLQLGGQHIFPPQEIFAAPRTVEGEGARRRELLLLRAITRYLNAGGSLELLQGYARHPAFETFRLSLPPGWCLIDVMPADDGAGHQLIFGQPDTGRCLVVEEDSFSEEREIHELGVQLAHERQPPEPPEV